jgi:non-heme chloroperoxidase
VNGVVVGLHDPIDPTFARSFVADTSSVSVEPAVLDQLAHELLKVPAHVWKAVFNGLLEYDDMDELERITAPTLLVWGDADGLVDRDMQTKLATGIRNAELVVYSGIGHTPRWEDPWRFAGEVAAFVKRLPARRDRR